jgi:predicted component of type VI protein secretion system
LDGKDSVTLGKWKLGIRSVLGKTVMSDSCSLEISIGEISPEQMRLFETGANNDLILKCLMDLMLPFDRDTRVKYRVTESRKKFKLSVEGHKTYLGINTTI